MSQVWKGIEQLEDRDGLLYIEGCSVADLVEEYGTPLYVYSEGRIRENYHRLVEAYRRYYPNFEVYYAIKANNNPAIARILASEGAGCDCSCAEEILIAEEAGFPRNKLLYTGVYVSSQELAFALERKIPLNIENRGLLNKLDGFGVPEQISFRINPDIAASGDERLLFAGGEAKFGIINDDVAEAYMAAKALGVKRFGVHMMTGSNIMDPEYFARSVEMLMEIVGPIAQELNITFDFIDIGGSLGIPYRPGTPSLDVDHVARRVSEVLREKLHKYSLPEPTLIHEPGRYLVGDAGVMVSQVTALKERPQRFVGVDAGMQTLLRPALYGSYHHIIRANNLNAGPTVPCHVVGPICENTDQFAADRPLPADVAEGDLLAFLDAGAYGFCMSSQYNTRPRAAEVLVLNGQHCAIRKAETLDDLLRGTAIPEWHGKGVANT